MVAYRSNIIVSARVRGGKSYLERESGEDRWVGNSECERQKNEYSQLLSRLDERRQTLFIHLSGSAFTGGGEGERGSACAICGVKTGAGGRNDSMWTTHPPVTYGARGRTTSNVTLMS